MATEPRLLDHEYDGIREYDNPTPGWWHVLFLFFIVFGACYLFVAAGSPMYSTPAERHEAAKLAWIKTQFGELGTLQPDEATIVRYYADEQEAYAGKWMPYAASLYRANCVSCHASRGEGSVGPNLTDDAFINIKSITDIYTTLQNGVTVRGMPAWGNRFHPNELVLLSSYVASLRGQNIPGKAAEGQPIPPWPTLNKAGPAAAAEPGP